MDSHGSAREIDRGSGVGNMDTNPFVFIFEVLDKEDSLQTIWVSGFAVAFAGFLLCRWWWQLIFAVLPSVLIFGWVQTSEFFEPYIGDSMLAESRSYVFQLFASVALAAIVPSLGALLQYRNALAKKSRFL
jgi:hypothetical protein